MMLARSSALTGKKVPGPTCRVRLGEADAGARQGLDQGRGEMEAGGGGGDRPFGAGEDRLVIGPVARVAAARSA